MKFRLKALRPIVAVGAVLALAACSSAGTVASSEPTAEGLAEPTTVKVVVSSKIAYFVPYLMEEHWGEFAKQNIKLEVDFAPAPDALVLLATGKVDAIVSGPSANILNAVAQGSEVRMVAPGAIEPADSVNGWYVSKAALNGAKFDVSLLEGQTLASSSGVAGPPLLTLSRTLEEAGLTLADINISSMKQTDTVIAIENGAVFGGTASQPNTTVILEADSGEMFARSAPLDYPSVSLMFGPTLLSDNTAVGDAFVLALLNTYKNHMQGDWLHDEKNIDLIAEVLETDKELLLNVPSALYPTTLAFPTDYIESYEDVFRQMPDVLSYDADTTVAARVTESRFMDFANGK